jgi:hypothetical protein
VLCAKLTVPVFVVCGMVMTVWLVDGFEGSQIEARAVRGGSQRLFVPSDVFRRGTLLQRSHEGHYLVSYLG